MLGENRFVDIGGRSLYASVRGAGPTVVLNSAGGREGVGSWSTLETRLSEFATVVAYDRCGIGRSPPVAEPPTARDMAVDLKRLLDALEVPRPVVLVGWSLSGLLVQLYACEHPRDVAGLLLLDPTPDEFVAGYRKLPPDHQHSMRTAALANLQKAGGTQAHVWELAKVFESSEEVWQAVMDERKMPDIEVVVVTACLPAQAFGKSVGGSTMMQPHRRIAERVARGRHLLAERSSHRTLIENDSDLIVAVVRQLLGARDARER